MVPPRPTAKSRTLSSRGIATLRPGCAGRPGRHTSNRWLRSSRSQIARSGATWKTIGPRGPSPQPHFPFAGREKPTSRALARATIASGAVTWPNRWMPSFTGSHVTGAAAAAATSTAALPTTAMVLRRFMRRRMREAGKAAANRHLRTPAPAAIISAVTEFRVLGPVEALVDGRPIDLPAAKPRSLLALLLLKRNRVVSVDELISELWNGEPPETATKALQVYISQLRKALGADRVITKAPGYSVRVVEGELDLDRFEQHVRDGRERLAAGDAKKAAQLLGAALQLWRGPPVVEWLEEARLAAVEERIDADLALGRHDRVVSEPEELVAHHPFRETLIEELGIEPSTELQELEQAILRQDPTLERRRPPVPSAREPTTRRRRSLVPIAAIVVLAIGATAAALLLSDRGGSSPSRDTELRAFVVKMENFLDQSRQGRRDVADTVSAAFDCRLAPHAAAVRLNRVQRNRQSLLQQVAALSVPASENALLASDLLQKAGQASIAADWHYRDWLLGHRRCVPPDGSRELRAARSADITATQAKQSFTSVFNPLARHFHQKTWRASEF